MQQWIAWQLMSKPIVSLIEMHDTKYVGVLIFGYSEYQLPLFLFLCNKEKIAAYVYILTAVPSLSLYIVSF